MTLEQYRARYTPPSENDLDEYVFVAADWPAITGWMRDNKVEWEHRPLGGPRSVFGSALNRYACLLLTKTNKARRWGDKGTAKALVDALKDFSPEGSGDILLGPATFRPLERPADLDF